MPTTDDNSEASEGMTKREYFAGLAMQGLMAGMSSMGFIAADVATASRIAADALLAELDKDNGNG